MLGQGKIPKRIHAPSLAFERPALDDAANGAALTFPIAFLQGGLQYTVAGVGDQEVSYRTIIETTFVFQQFIKCSAELETATFI